jgi:hypothetical protein
MTEPAHFTPEQLNEMSEAVATMAVHYLGERNVSTGHAALIMAVAAATVHKFVYGLGGLEQLRTVIDLCEQQHPGMGR